MNWDELPLSAEQASVLTLVVALLASVIVVPGMVLDPSPSAETDGATAEPVETPRQGTIHSPDEGTEFQSVPGSYTRLSTDDVPPPEVRTSAGSQTMQINVATDEDGDPVLNLTDDRMHDGRFVAVNTEWFETAVGEVPETAHIAHENGSTYTEPIEVRGDEAVFYVRAFSTNTVSFDGEFALNATPAEDGDSFEYNASEGGDSLEINVTGVVNTQWDNVSKTSVGDGNEISVHPDGNLAPLGPENGEPRLTLTGQPPTQEWGRSGKSNRARGIAENSTHVFVPQSDDNIYTYNKTDGDWTRHTTINSPQTVEVTPSGNYAVGGYVNKIAYYDTAHNEIYNYATPDYTRDIKLTDSSEHLIAGHDNGAVTKTAEADGSREWDVDVFPDVVTAVETDGSSGAVVGTDQGGLAHVTSSGSVDWNVTVSSAVNDLVKNDGEVYALLDGGEIVRVNLADGNTETVATLSEGPGSAFAAYPSGDFVVGYDSGAVKRVSQSGSVLWSIDNADGEVFGLATKGNGSVYYSETGDAKVARVDSGTSAPAADIDSDGVSEAEVAGFLKGGQSKTFEIASLDLSDETTTITTANGTEVDVIVELEERTQTTDAAVEVNGHTTGHDGTLEDGETVTLSTDDAWIEEGMNQVNVSVGDDTLSSGAPTPQVNLDYTHDISEEQSVDYTAEAWSERYVVSKTWQEDTDNATLTIPWASDRVVALRNVTVEYRDSNGNLASTDSDPAYSFENGSVVVELGDVPQGWETTVDADGSKVQVQNGSITVLEPTAPGSPLDSKIKVDSKSDGFAIAVDGTDEGNQVHYLNNETWSGEGAYSVYTSDGDQKLHLPNAGAGSETRLRTLPLEFSPDANEVVVEVPDDRVNETQPVYRVRPGATTGDGYDVTFVDAADSEEYILYDESNDIVVDSGTASSPLTLSADSDEDAILQFRLDTGGTSSSIGSGDAGGAGGIVPTQTGPNWLPLIGVGVVLAGLAVAARRDGAIENAGETAGDATADATSRLPVIGERVGSLLETSISWVASGAQYVFGNGIVAAGVGGAILVGAVQSDIIAIPEGTGVIVLVAAVSIGSILVLREIDEFTMPVWVGINVATALIALETLSDQGLIAAVSDSEVFPLIAIGGLYLGYRLLGLIRDALGSGGNGDSTVTVQVRDGED